MGTLPERLLGKDALEAMEVRRGLPDEQKAELRREMVDKVGGSKTLPARSGFRSSRS